MAILGALNKIGISFPTQQTAPATAPVAPAQQPVRPQGDTFVRSAPQMAAAPARPAALTPLPSAPAMAPTGAAPAVQSLGFADMMAKDPSAIWSTAQSPRLKEALASFKMGKLGQSVKDLDLRNMTAGQVRLELMRRGFKSEMSCIKNVATGQPLLVNGKKIPMEIWSNPDGGMVRIKPDGDVTNRFRPQAHLSISVKYPPDASGNDFNDEAFKVDYKGNAMPKWPKDANNPFPADTPAGKKFLDDLADDTHTNLR